MKEITTHPLNGNLLVELEHLASLDPSGTCVMKISMKGFPIPVHVCSMPDTGAAVRKETSRFLSDASGHWLDAAVALSADVQPWKEKSGAKGKYGAIAPAKGIKLAVYEPAPGADRFMELRGDAGRVLLRKDLPDDPAAAAKEALRLARDYAAKLAASAAKALAGVAVFDPYPEYGAPGSRPPARNDLEELARLLVRTGSSIRAVPETVRHVYEDTTKNRECFPDAVPRHVEGYPSRMLVGYTVPACAGKFLLATDCDTCATVKFNAKSCHDSLEDVLDALRALDQASPDRQD